MHNQEKKPSRLQRSFIDLKGEVSYTTEQHSVLTRMGWKGDLKWSDLLKSQRILIISEAGAGKTYECREEQSRLIKLGESAFYLDLAELSRSNLKDLLSSEEEGAFDAWLSSQSEVATFFLDSIDELKLTLGSFESALKRLSKALSGQLFRARIVITTRPVPVDINLIHQYLPTPNKSEFVSSAESFANLALGINRQSPKKEDQESDVPAWRTVSLLPLSMDQIRQMAVLQGIGDTEALIQDIYKRNAEEFAQRPQDLIELCTDWRDHLRTRTHRNQVAYNIDVKLRPRLDPGERAPLSPERALEGASRLALAALLTRRLTIRHSQESDVEGVEAALNPSAALSDWSAEERATLLERSLFGFASYGRVRFHHRSVVEYLAAHRLNVLVNKGMSIRALIRLLFTETAQGTEVTKPSMRSVAGWLALSQPATFEELLKREPEVLLNHGDPESLTPAQRVRALRAYVGRYGHGGWRGLHVPRIQVHRFASKEISEEILVQSEAGIENLEVRELLMELLAACPIPECADLTFSIAMNKGLAKGERLEALEALAKLEDSRLPGVVSSLEDPAGPWENDARKAAILKLYPDHISAHALGKVLKLIVVPKRSAGDIGWLLSHAISDGDAPLAYLNELRESLTDLVLSHARWSKRFICVDTEKRHLIEPLATICQKLLRNEVVSSSVIQSCVIALKVSREGHHHKEDLSDLKLSMEKLPAQKREEAFWADDSLHQRFNPGDDPNHRWFEVCYHGVIRVNSTQDAGWVLSALSDHSRSLVDRELLLEVAMREAWDGVGDRTDYWGSLKQYVKDQPSLLERIDRWVNPAPNDKEIRRLELEHKKRQEQEKRRQAKRYTDWVLFWRDVANNPGAAFGPARSESTAWNLWIAMKKSGDDGRASGWNRRFIEMHFGKEVADRLRAALTTIWRQDKPTLRSERPDTEKNTYLVRWQLGLAAISAEAEDADWARKLTDEEAKLAVRYVPLELNGFPHWLEGLTAVHSSAVATVLGSELSSELEVPASENFHSAILQCLNNAEVSVASVFLPTLLGWVKSNSIRLAEGDSLSGACDRVRSVAGLLVKFGDQRVRHGIKQVATEALSQGLSSPFAAAWLPILLRLDLSAGIAIFEQGLATMEPATYGDGAKWFGRLFNDRYSEFPISPTSQTLTPDHLLRLTRLAYLHVRPTDDLVHESVYSPDARDHAERARDTLLQALLNYTGPEGWAVKVTMANDPLFSHFRDRAMRISIEKAAEEADAATLPESELGTLDRYGETGPITRDDMFSLLNDRLNDLEDLLLRDDSPRAAWASINDEKVMRRVIAHELNTSARSSYKVDQESVTGDEKETDIRLRSTASEQQAVIELKIGEKDRSGRDLRNAIRDQLVKKYMAPEACRTGCLLVTVSSNRAWEHPDTGESMDIKGLEAMLQQEAKNVVVELGYSLRLTVRILNLTPRLNTERNKIT